MDSIKIPGRAWKRELAVFLNRGFTDGAYCQDVRLCHRDATRGIDVECYVHRMLDRIRLRPRRCLALAR
jgi:hypothetical protein